MSPQVNRARSAPASWLGRALVGLSLAAAGDAAAVIGGQVQAGDPERAAVMVLNSRGGVCSGVLVASDIVLTAAHCVPAREQIRVHYREPDGAPVLLEPASRVSHPGYVANAVAARRPSVDLALVRLGEALPARFAAARLSAAQPRAGERVQIAGFGVAQPGDARSTGTFRAATLAVVEPHGRSRILLWAAAPQGVRAGACEGDSGGPVTNEDGEVVALSSWSAGRAGGCGEMSQAVLLGPQRGWIDGIVASWGGRATWR